MINFKDYLIEGRQAPLYHSITIDDLFNNLKGKILTGFTVNRNTEHSSITGISMTRDIKFAEDFGEDDSWYQRIILMFDQQKLNQTNKIVPFNFFDYKIDGEFSSDYRSESEEFVVGDIKNISRSLIKILIPVKDKSKKDIKDIEKQLKLKNFTNYSFLKNGRII